METVTRRHARLEGGRPKKALQYLNEFRMLYENEGVHTLEGGVVRRKRRLSRRPTLPIEPAWLFYPKFAWESARKALQLLARLPPGEGAAEAGARTIPARYGLCRPRHPPARP